jgi:hypothetical protein
MNIDLNDLIAASFLTKELNFSESVFENLNITTDFSTFDLRYLKNSIKH